MPAWMSWIGHGLVGFWFAFLAGEAGACLAIGFYSGKEYVESDHLKHISRDNAMDIWSPTVGAGLGLLLRNRLWNG